MQSGPRAPGRGLARWLRGWSFPLLTYAVVAAIVLVLAAVFATAGPPWYHGPGAFGGWARNDAGWYRSIVDNGYFFSTVKQSSVAFFPAYPYATKYLAEWFGGDPTAWGVIVTLASGCTIAALFHRWCRERMPAGAAATALFVMLLWPYSLYLFGAVYADALFLAMVLLAFTFVEHDRPLLAALAGAVATATRPVGAAVVLGLVLRVLERRGALRLPALDRVRFLQPVGGRAGAPADVAAPPADQPRRWYAFDMRRLRPRDPLVILAAGGLLGYMVYLWDRFGEPFAFARAESAPGWDQHPGAHVWLKFAWWSRLIHLSGSDARYFGNITFQALLAAGLLLLVPLVVKRFGWAYAIYTLVVLAIPLVGSKDFMGIGRYSLTAFPSFAVFGELLASHRRVRDLWFVCAGGLMVVLAIVFARNGYVA